MLQELHVKNLGIIEDIDWKLDAGLNVITGETGAGKSLIIDAVEILLNGSAADDVIRYGCPEARIEGVFDLSETPRCAGLKAFLEEKGLAADESILVVSYEIKRAKTGQARVNNRVVTKGLLRQVGRLLIDIHGQSQHLSLLDPSTHLEFLDAFGRTTGLSNEFAARLAGLNELESELADLQESARESLRQQEFLKFQIEEIQRAGLFEGEDEDLEKERHIISQAIRLKEEALLVYQTLSQNDSSGYTPSVMSTLRQALQALKKLTETDNSMQTSLENLEKAFYNIEETARDIEAYAEKLDFDPHRQEEVESRLELIRGLKRKYGKSIPEILTFRDQAQKDLDKLTGSEERQLVLKPAIAALRKTCGQIGINLSVARRDAAERLAARVKKELVDLEMSSMDFAVAVNRNESPNGLPGENDHLYAFNPHGLDDVEFLVATNPGEPLKPLVKIASTGEISRFTLALKGALAEADCIPVLIFDEIDIGVGGRSGDIVGRKLWSLSCHHQVVCVTHLPQIAAFADRHYFVHKQTTSERTSSSLENLDDDARLKEIAQMLAGPDFTPAALANARELLSRAAAWKKQYHEKINPA